MRHKPGTSLLAGWVTLLAESLLAAAAAPRDNAT
jgi:hypothetical protein